MAVLAEPERSELLDLADVQSHVSALRWRLCPVHRRQANVSPRVHGTGRFCRPGLRRRPSPTPVRRLWRNTHLSDRVYRRAVIIGAYGT